jgi:hypothetical protein
VFQSLVPTGMVVVVAEVEEVGLGPPHRSAAAVAEVTVAETREVVTACPLVGVPGGVGCA